MQQTLETGYWQSARLNGVLRYHLKSLGRTVSLVLLILLGSQLLSLAFPLLTGEPYPFMGVYADPSVTLVVALVCGCVTAGKSTRFLLRFGTSRLSVWLGNVLALWVGMVALLLGTLLLSMVMGGLVLALTSAMPAQFAIRTLFSDLHASGLYTRTLGEALTALPASLLYTLEWASLFYLFGCCLRRNRALTLTVIIGLPMLLLMLTLIPAVRQAASVVQNANDQQMMLLGVQWMKYLVDAVHFVENEWPTLQLLAAVASLPLSYLCMRGTQQP